MANKQFLKRYSDSDSAITEQIWDIDEELTDLCWLPLLNQKIEPDNWDLFWKLWNEQKIKSSPKGYENAAAWETLCIWKAPHLSEADVQKIYPQKVVDWSDHFPNMLNQLLNLMPFSELWKITLATSTSRVAPHIDRPYLQDKFVLYPWPNSLRVLLHDQNDRPTFYLTRWPDSILKKGKIQNLTGSFEEWGSLAEPSAKEKCYVQLPEGTNAFVYSNGPFLHGADYHGKPKVLVLFWGRPDPEKWKIKLRELKDNFPQCKSLCQFGV